MGLRSVVSDRYEPGHPEHFEKQSTNPTRYYRDMRRSGGKNKKLRAFRNVRNGVFRVFLAYMFCIASLAVTFAFVKYRRIVQMMPDTAGAAFERMSAAANSVYRRGGGLHGTDPANGTAERGVRHEMSGESRVERASGEIDRDDSDGRGEIKNSQRGEKVGRTGGTAGGRTARAGEEDNSEEAVGRRAASRSKAAIFADAPLKEPQISALLKGAAKRLIDLDELDAEEGGEEPNISLPGRGKLLSEPDRLSMQTEIERLDAAAGKLPADF